MADQQPDSLGRESLESDRLNKAWEDNLVLIKSFLDQRPRYKQLCSEVDYILGKRMRNSNIEYSAITSRAKTLNSFLEKLTRKSYANPLEGITDFAGVRLVYLYKGDQSAIENLIEQEFDAFEKIDKVQEQDVDRFGYGALHYLVRLGEAVSGARYDELKGLTCEIQVRTVLQDAWAIIDHHLVYKHESDIPKEFRRKLNSVSGLFEIADDQFQAVRLRRDDYKRDIHEKSSGENFLDQEMNFDNFVEYLNWRFPGGTSTSDVKVSYNVYETLKLFGYKKLADIENLLRRTDKAVGAFIDGGVLPNKIGRISLALSFVHPEYIRDWPQKNKDAVASVLALVEP